MPTINANNGLTIVSNNDGELNLQSGGVTAVSINSSGMYVKSVTTAQMEALTPTVGTIVFNTTLKKLCVYALVGEVGTWLAAAGYSLT